jgi:hypothetical protein
MKKLVILWVLALFGCNESNVEKEKTGIYINTGNQLEIVLIDGCQYFYGSFGHAVVLTHKGNCNNIIHKLKSE